jgi:outer membrane protein TolC
MRSAAIIALFGVILTTGCVSTNPPVAGRHGTPVPGQTDAKAAVPAENSTIDDYLNYALQNNRGLRASGAGWQSATKRIKQARSLDDPTLSFNYMLEQRDMQYGVGLTQVIPGFGKLGLRKNVATARAAAAKHDHAAVRLEVFEHVIKSFYNYHYLERAMAITDENIALLSQLESVLLTRHKTAKARYSDVLKVQVEKDRLLDQRASLKDMRPVISAELCALLDLPSDHVLPWPKATRSADSSLSSSTLVDMLEYLNPELKAMDSTIEGLSLSTKLAKKGYLPDFTIGGEFIVMPEAEGGSTPTDTAVKVGLSLPLWWGKNKAAIAEASLAHESAVNARKQLENDLIVELKEALAHLQNAERKIKLFKESLIPKAEQAFAVAKKEFMGGTAQFMTLIDAQRTLLEFGLMLERAQANREIAFGHIGCCVGKYNVKVRGRNSEARNDGGK